MNDFLKRGQSHFGADSGGGDPHGRDGCTVPTITVASRSRVGGSRKRALDTAVHYCIALTINILETKTNKTIRLFLVCPEYFLPVETNMCTK